LIGHKGWVSSAAFSPDDKYIVTASGDKTARVWDAGTGKMLVELSGHKGWVHSAAFSLDGKSIVTTSEDKTAQVWDAATGSQLIELAGHKGWVYSAAYSPDGKSIVTAGEDKTVRIYGHELCCSFDSLVSSSRFIRNLTPEEREKYLHEKRQQF
jgi:WD40 repeat protein